MLKTCLAAVAAVSLLSAGQASAAVSLDGIKGQVLVSRGGHFVPASESRLEAGDRVVSMGDSAARVTYADGCSINIAARAMATVGDQSPCAAARGLVRTAEPQALIDASARTLWTLFGVGFLAFVISENSEDPLSP